MSSMTNLQTDKMNLSAHQLSLMSCCYLVVNLHNVSSSGFLAQHNWDCWSKMFSMICIHRRRRRFFFQKSFLSCWISYLFCLFFVPSNDYLQCQVSSFDKMTFLISLVRLACESNKSFCARYSFFVELIACLHCCLYWNARRQNIFFHLSKSLYEMILKLAISITKISLDPSWFHGRPIQ